MKHTRFVTRSSVPPDSPLPPHTHDPHWDDAMMRAYRAVMTELRAPLVDAKHSAGKTRKRR